MGRMTSLAKLPPGVRAKTERLILIRECSYSEITARLQIQGFKISRSAIGRHAQKMRRLFGDFAQFPLLLTDENAALLLILAELRGIRDALAGKGGS